MNLLSLLCRSYLFEMAGNTEAKFELDFDEEIEDCSTAVNESPTYGGGYASIHSSGFKDFLLKPELLRAINDCGFEHPSEGN